MEPVDTDNQGDRLRISLQRNYKAEDTFQVAIKYSLDERAKALNFLTKDQTSGKSIILSCNIGQPYVFS